MTEAVLTRHFGLADSHTLRVYRAAGGYQGWEKAKGMEPAAITEEVKKANLRGPAARGSPPG